MSGRAWKTFELSVARQFGTTRRLMKGTDEKADIGDDSYPLCVDAKRRIKWSLHKWLRELREYAEREGRNRPPILVARKPPGITRYAFVPWAWMHRQIRLADAVQMFKLIHHKGKTRWYVQKWFKEGRKKAGQENKIAIVIFSQPDEDLVAVLEAHVLVSVLKAAGTLPYEQEVL